MRIPRFFATGSDIDTLKKLEKARVESESCVELAEDDLIKRLRSVLRLGHGHKFLLLDGEGRIYELLIDRLEKSRVYCLLKNVLPGPAQRSLPVRLGIALIKTDRLEWCIEKLTELGVTEIVPVLTRHCVARVSHDAKGEGRQALKLVRWQAIAREAAEQCERATIPPVVKPQDLAYFLSHPSSGGRNELRFICVERLSASPLAKALSFEISNGDLSAMAGIDSISLLVGPEGGFTASEITCAQEQGWMPVTLGPRILRSETAAIAAMSQVASILDI